MKSRLKIKYNAYDNFLYLILIPFLYPRGFQEYFSLYKLFFTTWLYLAMVLIIGMFFYHVIRLHKSYKICVWTMLAYYVAFITITLIMQGGISEGLQKLFMAPALCLFCAMCLQNKINNFVRCVSNLLLLNFALNLTVFNPLLWNNFFNVDGHIIFIGHVQVASQLGILGLFIAYVLYRQNEVKKSKWLVCLSYLTMLISETAASYVALIIITLGYLLLKFNKKLKNNRNISKILLLGFIGMNILFLYILRVYSSGLVSTAITAATSGRTYVWREALALMNDHWVFGYGVYGVLIKVFWSAWSSNPGGMNYAHNELLQRLLDGGLVLMLLFLIMLLTYISGISKAKDSRIKYYANICLLSLLVIMLFESVTEYYYFFIVLSMFAYLPEITNSFVKEE